MPSPKKNSNSVSVEAITHDDGRVNIPTADSVSLVSESIKTPIKLIYPRDTSLDPQLVWKGKDEQDSEDLIVEVPPLFIQEKVDPRVLVENLQNLSPKGAEPTLSLFDDFDGLEGLETVEFYQHDANWSNRLILGDSLEVLSSLAERENLRGQVQMVYLDPPYGIKFGSNWQVKTSKRAVKDSIDDASRDVEQVKAFRDTWELGIHSYLAYLRDRILAARDLLTETGSIFVQIGEQNVHLIRNILDEVFGDTNFVREIIYQKTTGAGSPGELTSLPSVCDYIIWYAKNKEVVKYRQLYKEKSFGSEGASGYTNVELPDGSRRSMTSEEKQDPSKLPIGSRIFAFDNTRSQSGVDKTRYPVEIDGKTYRPDPEVWKTHELGMKRLIAAGRIHAGASNLAYIRYLEDFPAVALNNIWTDAISRSMSDKVYVVQSSTKTVQRCMLMTTDPGDIVLDPTCGGGTTAVVAEQWGRRWITCDTSRVALAITRTRLMTARFPSYILVDSILGQRKLAELTGKPPLQSQTTEDVRKGFVCKRVPHITLKSIANNPSIEQGMRLSEANKIITQGSEFELLVDQPEIDNKKVRVSGPFTVESLSPHRAIGSDDSSSGAESKAIANPKQKPFEIMLLENLVTAGVQNGRKSERFEFDSFQPTAGRRLFAELVAKDIEQNHGRIAVSIGPRYGTVGVDFIKEAAREAVRGQGFATLLVLGFAFDPQALEAVAEFAPEDVNGYEVGEGKPIGDLRILLVRMNADLAMGEKLLKKSKAANLFTVFGEPDVGTPVRTADGWTLEINGFDVYNPITGDVRSGSATDIAMWMIDTNYNGESFFVRHAYFPGGDDPYKKLKAALKAEIDADAWASLNSTISRPFPTPTTGKIAVKIINDYGDEVMKVIEIADK